MNPIEQLLQKKGIGVLDGAMSTELEKEGHDLNDSLWSAKILIEDPAAIQKVHADYFKSGADIAITASYQATLEGMREKGLSDKEADDVFKRSVKVAQDARTSGDQLVAGSVGPYGAYLADGSEYRGQYGVPEQVLIDFHRPRIRALLEAGADLLACETIPSLEEAVAITKVLEEFPDAYAWITFSAQSGSLTCNGDAIEHCAERIGSHPQVAAIGINCTPPQYVEELITRLKSRTETPIIVYPNSGETYDGIKKEWSGRSEAEHFGAYAAAWKNAGATLIGGCCRTGPEHICEVLHQRSTQSSGRA